LIAIPKDAAFVPVSLLSAGNSSVVFQLPGKFRRLFRVWIRRDIRRGEHAFLVE